MLYPILKRQSLPAWLDDNGLINLQSAVEIDKVSPEARALWCHINARDGFRIQDLTPLLRRRASTLDLNRVRIWNG